MIIKIGILLVLILGALVFLGIKMGESIKTQEIKLFFFVLYAASIFTLFNIIISVYFFISLKNKRGPPGQKGKKGEMGDKGDKGTCVEDNCLKKSLETLILDTLESKPIKVTQEMKKVICKFSDELDIENKKNLLIKNRNTFVDELILITNETELITKLSSNTIAGITINQSINLTNVKTCT